MVMLGLAYLFYEDRLLHSADTRRDTKSVGLPVARALTGVQIGLVVLAMLVTRSSSLSLQARQGLPRGNQVVGWVTLGESTPRSCGPVLCQS